MVYTLYVWCIFTDKNILKYSLKCLNPATPLWKQHSLEIISHKEKAFLFCSCIFPIIIAFTEDTLGIGWISSPLTHPKR